MPYVKTIEYSALQVGRIEAWKRFGELRQFPIVPSPYSECKRLWTGGKVLDVGGGAPRHLAKVLGTGEGVYHGLDTDPGGQFEYHSFDEIPEGTAFQLVVMNQVLEHLTVDDAYACVKSAFAVTQPGGALFISVPNAAHPIRYFTNVTHVTNWNWGDLYGMVKLAGYTIEALTRSNKHQLTRNPLKRWVVDTVCRQFRVDWCDTLNLAAYRAEEQSHA